MTARRGVALLALFHGLAAAQAPDSAIGAAPELGRLFFSVAEREQLERDRGRPKAPVAAPDTPAQVMVNGLISGPGRPPLPVVNGRVLGPGTTLSGLRIAGQADGRVRVATAEGPSRLARPGQTVDVTTGETTEWFDLPGRRRGAGRGVALPVPFVGGVAPHAEPAPSGPVAKVKKPRRSAMRRGGRSGHATPPPATKAHAAPAAPQRPPMITAPAPAIPIPSPSPPVRP